MSECVAALAAGGGLFNRGGSLVRVIEAAEARAAGLLEERGDMRRDDKQLVIVPVGVDYLRLHLGELVAFMKHDARSGKDLSADCTKDIAAAILALGEWKGIPPLLAITRAPFLRADGTVCTTPGYDAASAVLLSGISIAVPENPTRDDALAAYGTLREPFDEMPFTDAAAESAYFGLMLTMVARPILPTVPAFIGAATTRGSAKTLSVDCASRIVYGATPAKRSFPHNADEQRKVLHSALLAGCWRRPEIDHVMRVMPAEY